MCYAWIIFRCFVYIQCGHVHSYQCRRQKNYVYLLPRYRGKIWENENTEWIHAWRGKLGTRLDTLIEGVETCNQSKQRNELYPGASVLTPKWMWHVDNMILYSATLVVSENVMLVPNSHSTAKGNVILSSNFPRIRLLYFCQQINVLLPTEL